MRHQVGIQPGGYFGGFPPSRLGLYGGPYDTFKAMARAALGNRGERSPVVGAFKDKVVRYIQPKDYVGEMVAVRNALLQPSPFTGQPLLRYTNDPRHVEWVKDPQTLVEEINRFGAGTCDCDESATFLAALLLQLGREVEFVGLGFGPGDQLTHVGVRAREPKTGRWVWFDTVAGPREREAAERAKRIVTYSLD